MDCQTTSDLWSHETMMGTFVLKAIVDRKVYGLLNNFRRMISRNYYENICLKAIIDRKVD